VGKNWGFFLAKRLPNLALFLRALKSITVQRICRTGKDENEVRQILDAMWERCSKGEEILVGAAEKNSELCAFEKMLDEKA
jgi:hypothetical protein